MTNNFPKLYTQENRTASQVERMKDGDDRTRALVMLEAMANSMFGQKLPITDDHQKLEVEAISDFARNDFSEAARVVESLSMIVDFYKDLAEKYHEELTRLGAVIDEYGDVRKDPFVMFVDGEQVLGAVEVVEFSEEDADDLWGYYAKPYLPFASDIERDWILRTFKDQIAADEDN